MSFDKVGPYKKFISKTDQFGDFFISDNYAHHGTCETAVILSVYNSVSYLPALIGNINSQTLSSFMIVISDDGSQDNSQQYLREILNKSNNVIVIKQPNIGLTKSLKRMISWVDADYYIRHDVDDFSTAYRFEQQISFLKKNPRAIICSKGCKFDEGQEENIIIKTRSAEAKITVQRVKKARLFMGNFVSHGSFAFARRFYFEIGGYEEEFELAQDYRLLLKAVMIGDVFVMNPSCYFLRVSDNSLSASRRKSQMQFASDIWSQSVLEIFNVSHQKCLRQILTKFFYYSLKFRRLLKIKFNA